MTRRRTLAVLALAALVAIALVVDVVAGGSSSGLSSARHVLARDARFTSGPMAGTAFADVSNFMLHDAKACARHHSSADQRCAARFSAAAYASVTAFALVDCTQPGVFEARQAAIRQLDGIAAVDDAHGRARAPRVPGVPDCT